MIRRLLRITSIAGFGVTSVAGFRITFIASFCSAAVFDRRSFDRRSFDRRKIFDANVAVHQFGPFGLQANVAFVERDFVAGFVGEVEIKRFQHNFAVENERCFLATFDSKFDFVPLAFGFFDTCLLYTSDAADE